VTGGLGDWAASGPTGRPGDSVSLNTNPDLTLSKKKYYICYIIAKKW